MRTRAQDGFGRRRGHRFRLAAGIATWLVGSGAAADLPRPLHPADEAGSAQAAPAPALDGRGGEPIAPAGRSARVDAPHAAYVEVLGKGGVYGLGYDWAFADRLAVGGVASFLLADDQRVLTLAPYLNAYPLAGRRSALLLQAGPQFVHVGVPSRVAGFSGTSSTGLGGHFSVGYEYRSRFLFRFLVTGVFGRGGIWPWTGIGLGGAFR